MESEDIILRQTTNYQLCQWDGEDRILRTDFNADNAKIDAAIADNAAAIAAEAEARAAGDFRVRLLDKTLQGGVTVDVDLSGIDFSPYVRAELYIGCPASMQSFTIRFNDITNYKSGSETSSAAATGERDSNAAASLAVQLWTVPGTSRLHCALLDGSYHTDCGISLSQLRKLTLVSHSSGMYPITSGSRVLIYGIRR